MRILFCGSKSLGLSMLRQLVAISRDEVVAVCHPEDSGDSRSALQSFSDFCLETDIPISIVLDNDSLSAVINEIKPDLVVVCGWYRIIPQKILSLVPRGFIAIHNSLLPSYKGGSPLVWAIINGESVVGSTLFRLSEGVDDGPILHQISVAIEKYEKIESVMHRIEKKICAEFPAKILDYAKSPWELEKQVGPSTTHPIRKPRDGKIDFSLSVDEVCNFIHAQSHPYPGAFTFFRGKTVRIWSAYPTAYNLDKPFPSSHKSVGAKEKLEFNCANGTIWTYDWEEE